MADTDRQGSGIIHLGTPTNPTRYTARIVRGPSEWQRLALAFIATEPTLRIALLGQAASAGNTVEYDGIRFLPPGRNPVLLMAAIFARFLPHLTLDAASVAVAADRRNEWLFSGYIPDPGRTDALLTKMSQECFCTVFKDLDGVYKITADDPDHSPALHLDSQHDIFQETLEVQGLPMEQVYTDFYLWYQRVTTQVTTSQAGQYAAVLYVTPDDSISQYGELQTLCAQAADTLQTRTRFDFFCDFIADPATADLLLSRFVRQLSVLRREVSLQAALLALPLSVTDHVAVRAPLLGPQPFVGEMRRAALTFAAQTPGVAMGLTLRESGLLRGVWETWDVAGLSDLPGSVPPGAARVRETWEEGPEPPPGPWFLQSAAPPPGVYCYALLAADAAQLDLAVGFYPGSFWTNHTQPPVWLFREANVASGSWDAGLTLTGGGPGTALGVFGGQVHAAVRPVAAPQTYQLWRLEASPSGTGTATLLTALRPLTERIWALHAYAGMGDGNWLYLGNESDNDITRWNGTTLETVPFEFSGAGSTVRSFFVMTDQGTHLPDFYAVVDGQGTGGNSLCRLVRDPELRFVRVRALPGAYSSNVAVLLGTPMVAVGQADGSYIQMERLTSTDGFVFDESLFLFDGLTQQRPGPLAVYNNRLYFGRMSASATPMLELWRSVNGTAWSLEVDFAPYLAEDSTPDTNTGITALGVARGKLYAATGTLTSAGSAPGIRVYCHPIPEGLV